MAHSTFESRSSLPAMIVGEKFEVAYRCHVEQRGDCLLLLAFVGNASGDSLEGCYVSLAKFKMRGRMINDDDRHPWAVTRLSHSLPPVSPAQHCRRRQRLPPSDLPAAMLPVPAAAP